MLENGQENQKRICLCISFVFCVFFRQEICSRMERCTFTRSEWYVDWDSTGSIQEAHSILNIY